MKTLFEFVKLLPHDLEYYSFATRALKLACIPLSTDHIFFAHDATWPQNRQVLRFWHVSYLAQLTLEDIQVSAR